MEEKQLKGNLIEIVRNLCAKFDAQNSKDGTKVNDRPQEILAIRAKRERPRNDDGVKYITRSMRGLSFSTMDPCSAGW